MRFKKLINGTVCAFLIGLTINAFAAGIPDWRKTGTSEQQLKALIKTSPGTHHWMPEIAYRYQSLYWAAEQGKWEFADYQIRSMEKVIKLAANARVKRAPSIKAFRDNVFPNLYEAAKTKNLDEFRKAVAKTGAECMACHAKEGFAYISIPAVPPKPNSLVLGYPE